MPAANQIALSGLNAHRLHLAASAHNSANLSTDGFAKNRALHAEARGVQTRVDVVDLSAQARQRAEEINGPQNNVDAAEETVARAIAREGFKANARTVRAQDQMLSTLLDTFA